MSWPHTKRAWQRLKLTLAEYLVVKMIEDPKDQHDCVRNVALISAADEIRYVRRIYFPEDGK